MRTFSFTIDNALILHFTLWPWFAIVCTRIRCRSHWTNDAGAHGNMYRQMSIATVLTRVVQHLPSHTTVRTVTTDPPSTSVRRRLLSTFKKPKASKVSACSHRRPLSVFSSLCLTSTRSGATRTVHSINTLASCPRDTGFKSSASMKTMPSTPTEIIAQLPTGFERARESGDLLFFPSTVHKHQEFGVEVREFLHFCLSQRSITSSVSIVGDHALSCAAEQTGVADAPL